MPVATGSTPTTITMGIVLVACLAARTLLIESWEDKNVDLELNQFRFTISGMRSNFPFGAAIFNHDGFPVKIDRSLRSLPQLPQRKVQESALLASVPDTYPIRGTFFGCCASAMTRNSEQHHCNTGLMSTAALFIAHLVSSVIYHADRR